MIMDGLFPGGIGPVTNQKIDLAPLDAVVSDPGWPGPIARGPTATVGIATKVGASLCTTTAADHPMRIAYEALFGCGPPKDGDWDAPTLLYAVGDLPAAFEELGQGGAAVINAERRLVVAGQLVAQARRVRPRRGPDRAQRSDRAAAQRSVSSSPWRISSVCSPTSGARREIRHGDAGMRNGAPG